MTALILLLIPAAIFVFWLVIKLDKVRISAYLESKKFQYVDAKWRIFGHGWLGESSEGGNRIYRIRYLDPAGNTWEAWAKTKMFSGVYFSLEEIVLPVNQS